MDSGCDVAETLSNIVGAIVEYELHLEPNKLINFIDFYRVYRQSFSSNSQLIDSIVVPATFTQFIFDQSLLDTAAQVISIEAGEHVDAPVALHIQNQ